MEVVHVRVTELENVTGCIVTFCSCYIGFEYYYKSMDLLEKEDEYIRTVNKHTKQKRTNDPQVYAN